MNFELERLATIFTNAFPVMDSTEQQLALKLYNLLSEGNAVPVEKLAENTDTPLPLVEAMLEKWPGILYDDNHCIDGFWGLSINETDHHLEIKGKTVYTWCAWDTLFIPELLNETAHITSHCALSNDELTLTISPKGIESTQSDQIMVSFLVPDENKFNENIIASFCHYVFFFRSKEAGENWIAEHPGTFLLTLDDAFTVGKILNATRYNKILN